MRRQEPQYRLIEPRRVKPRHAMRGMLHQLALRRFHALGDVVHDHMKDDRALVRPQQERRDGNPLRVGACVGVGVFIDGALDRPGVVAVGLLGRLRILFLPGAGPVH